MIDRRTARRAALRLCACFLASGGPALAGNEANFVLYDHHTETKGTTEVNFLSDFSRAAPGEAAYSAQLIEIERALTDQWTMALYFEGDAIDGQDYAWGGWRVESRYRLLPYGAFLNPVLYVEYGDLQGEHRYLLEAVGRNDAPEEGASRELESRLILGHDFNDGFDVAFNAIGDVNLATGNWEFGYATGLNYTLFERPEGGRGRSKRHPRDGWDLKEVRLGAEVYGSLGDSTLGLTLDPNLTQHYAGLNLRGEFENGFNLQCGVALGLTDDSERRLVRVMMGYEFN
jgi:hypothetical protein